MKKAAKILYILGAIAVSFFVQGQVQAASWFPSGVEIISVHEGESIQSAVNKAKEGGVVLVSPGVYFETIILKKNLVLRSEAGAEQTTINGSHGSGTVVQMVQGSTLDGFTVTGRVDTDDSETRHAIECINTSATIKNNIIRDNKGTGIYLAGAKSTARVTDNQIYNNEGAGIGIENKSKATVTGNKCYANSQAGIGVQLGAAPIIKNNECFRNKMAGIGVRNKESAPVIENNECYDNELSGIGLEKQANVTLKNNHLHFNGRVGIGVHDASTAVIEGNTIEKNVLSGIGSRDNSKITVINNQIRNNVMAGITVLDGTEAVIKNNNIQANGTQGIICSSATAVIKKNQVSGNIHHGIGFYRNAKGEIDDNIISDNGANDKRGSGILIVSSNDTVIKHNEFNKNYGPGVYTRRCAPLIEENVFSNDLVFVKFHAAPTIKKNVFYAAGKSGGKTVKSGVDIRETSHPIIIDNEFYGKFGVSIRSNSDPLVMNNKFSGNHKNSISSGRSGIKVDRTCNPSIVNNIFYNGNKLLVTGKTIKKNVIITRTHTGRAKKMSSSVDFKATDHGGKTVIIAGNIFVGDKKSKKRR